MYNFSKPEQIPRYLPIAETVLLKPWFSSKLLEDGLQLIREGIVANGFFFRNSCGALIDGEIPLTLLYEPNNQPERPFIIRHEQCGICGKPQGRTRCSHLAALAILSLTPDRQGKHLPFPLVFQKGSWSGIGAFLYDHILTPFDLSLDSSEDMLVVNYSNDNTEGTVTLPAELKSEVMAFLPGKQKETDLWEICRSFTRTENEIALERGGAVSKGWQRDCSFWMWLATQLHLLVADQLPKLIFHKPSRHFYISLNSDTHSTTTSLMLPLPRQTIWEFVRKIGNQITDIPICAKAKECYQVSLSDNEEIDVIPCIHFDDGRIIPRLELEQDRFGSIYYILEMGFVPIIRCPVEATVKKPSSQIDTNPLFSYPNKEKQRMNPFSLPLTELEVFLETNGEALRHPDNQVDPDLLRVSIREIPDELVIDSYAEDRDWCYISCRYGLVNNSLSLEELLNSRKNNDSYIPGRKWLKLDDTPLSWFYDLLSSRIHQDVNDKMILKLSRGELLSLNSLIPETRIEESLEQPVKTGLNRLFDVDGWRDDSELANIPAHLRDYQRNGLAWLHQLYSLGLGGLLADDMGLGKTHQGLGLFQAAIEKHPDALHLVVCPASVVLHWAAKIDAFYPDISYSVYYGQNRDLDQSTQSELVLTTYGILRQDLARLSKLEFNIVLFDEIQHLKNPKTASHLAAVALPSRTKIGLTGTPIENNLGDLHALFTICLPGLLGTQALFHRQYVMPITEAKQNDVKKRLRRLIHPFVLRRNRKQVLTELPDIIEDNRMCRLSDDQVSLYRQIIDDQQNQLDHFFSDDSNEYIHILTTITKLKQVCNHPCLIEGCTDPRRYESGKWNLLLELIEECMDSQLKVVIFSQYVSMLDLIEEHLCKEKIGFARLRGDMTVTKRQEMIEQFDTDPRCRIFCASLLAGGTGIDLTAAGAVIHYDRWWNPAKEEQATARVHRMGQKNVVQLFRLITTGTLEEKIHHLLHKKRQLASSVIQEDEASIIKRMSRQQLQDLFHLQ